jgi:geranylgeranyl pyrophosphate synthase
MSANKGEFHQEQLKKAFEPENVLPTLEKYLEKNFYKTGCLFANGMVGIGEILNMTPEVKQEAFELGVWMGSLFQLVDDILDFRNNGKLDKESLKDVRDSIYNLSVFSVVAQNQASPSAAKSFLTRYTRTDKSDEDMKLLFEELSQETTKNHCEAMVTSLTVECENSLQRIVEKLDGNERNDVRSIFHLQMNQIVEMFYRRQK